MESIKSRFCEGDRVVWDKQPDKTWHVHFRFSEEYVNIINRSKGGFTSLRVHVDEIKHVNRKEELKQAIREVLLSDEFMTAFAKAWQKTPLVHVDEMKLTIEPITKSASEAVALRNRFGIGDTVVDQCTGSLAVVKNINESDGECEIQFEENHRYAYRWGSELSLLKKKVSDCKPSSIDANVSLYSSEVKKYER